MVAVGVEVADVGGRVQQVAAQIVGRPGARLVEQFERGRVRGQGLVENRRDAIGPWSHEVLAGHHGAAGGQFPGGAVRRSVRRNVCGIQELVDLTDHLGRRLNKA